MTNELAIRILTGDVLGTASQTSEAIRMAVKALSMQSAQPERNKGSWKRITEGRIPELYICPFCHRTIEDEGIEYMVAMRYPFCHCGADMRDEEGAQDG